MKTLIHITITFVIFGIHNLLGSATLQNGLVSHWKFDETIGTTAHDSSGNEYDAILYGTSNGSGSWVDGKVGGAVDLDGSNDYLAIKDLHYSQSGPIPAVSISVWIKSSKSTEAYIVSYDRSENWRLSMGGMNNNKKLFFASSNNGNVTSDKYGATILNDNNWHHVVVTYDKVTSQKIFYLDGLVDATHTVHSNRPLGRGAVTRYGTIGTTNEDSTYNDSSTTRGDYFNGLLDDLRIYDRAVTISEVGCLYSLGNRYGDPDGDGLYNFEEETLGTNPLLADTDGDGLNDSLEVQKFTTFERISRTGEFTFDEAVLDAEGRGGYLATITSSDENNDVDEIATLNEWLGATDRELEGTWKWLTGEHWTYSNWNPNEPNNSGNEDGLHFYSDGKWNDIPLTSDYAYILEKPVFTEISDPLNPDSDGNGYSDLLDKGLLVWYLFENNTFDMSGNNRHGTLSGSPTFSNAIQGKALSLDGVDDFIDIAHDSSLDPRREISISMWLKIASLNKTWTPLFYKGPGEVGGHRSYGLWLNSSKYFHPVSADSAGQEDADSISNSWTTNQWYHSVMVMNRNAGIGFLKFYLNGALLSEASIRTNDTASSSNSLRIGSTQETNSEYQTFHGSIDNLRIYDYAIGQDLVSKIYEIESNASISIVNISDHLPDGLHAYYKLDGNADEETNNGYDGSLAGTVNDPTNAPDRFNLPNRAFYFDGNDRLKLDHRALGGLSAFSLSIWAKVESFDKMPVFMSAASNAGANELFFFYTPNSGDGKIHLQENGSAESHNLANTVGLSTWRNLTLTRESGASLSKFYVDGNLEETFSYSSASGPMDVVSDGLWLGADQDSVGGGWENQQHFKGWMDEIRIYNRALNANEVDTIYEVTSLINSDSTDVDETAPIITLHGDSNVIHEAGLIFVDDNASWTDAVDGSGILVAMGEVNTNIPGTYILTFNFTDAAGNVAQTVTRTVNVVDTTAPLITLNGNSNITHEAGDLYVDTNASWTDAVDGSGVLVAAGQVNVSTPGTYLLSYNFTDAAVNVAQTVTRTVNVVDTIAPVITLNGDANITHEAGFVFVDANASWTDAVDGNGTLVATGEVNVSTPGTYNLSYNYTDAAGNVAQTITRTVNVEDTIAPVIALNGDANITHEAGFVFVDANASWTDAVDGSGTLVATGQVNVSIPGTYTLSHYYTDAAGNLAQTVTRTVNVVDTVAPVITLNGDAKITHEAGFVYVDGNASWTDAVAGSGVLSATGEVNASLPGTYTLSYNYTDGAGNVTQTITRTVNVVDTIAPTITLNGYANITHDAGFVYVDANATCTDAVDGSGDLVATGEVNANVPGTYELVYHYTDEAGNEADTVIRTVHVINLAPHDLVFLSYSNLSIYENEPGGTWIADFAGIDENPDSVLTYHLMGVWDASHSYFQEMNVLGESTDVAIEDVFDLDTNGSLTTVRPLDYETDPIFFEILIRVTDQHGAYYEKPFVVSVLNEVEDLDEDGVEDHYDLDDDGDGQRDELEIRLGLDPRDRFDHAHAGMVFTLDVENLENDEYRLRGELLTDGKASPIEYGFILTSTDQNSTLYTVAADKDGSVGEEFAKVVGDLDRGKSYVYQAYVINELGMGVGQMKWIRKIVEAKLPEIFNEAEEFDGGWYTSWMGEFWMGEERKWFYHLSLGWVFVSEDGQGGAWIWREPDGWLWTKSGVWPFLWSQDTANWTYLIENLSIPRLYDYSIRDLR